jgi:FkbM family methyltransferase
MFCKSTFFNKAVRSIALRMFHFVENNGDSVIDKNGEKTFVVSLFDMFKNDGEKERIIFDIGGNIGDYSEILVSQSQVSNVKIQLHIFEPTKGCFKMLLNKFSSQNIRLNNFGLSSKDADFRIFYDKEKSGLASLYKRNLKHYNIDMSEGETIRVGTAKDYIESNYIKHIDFVKIDIEGHELEAFNGFGNYLSGEFIDFIQFEYGGAFLDSKISLMQLYEYFEAKGFSIAKVMQNGIEIRDYKPYMENFSNSNYIAISNSYLETNVR